MRKEGGEVVTGAAEDFDDFYELDGDFGSIHFRGLYLWTSVVISIQGKACDVRG